MRRVTGRRRRRRRASPTDVSSPEERMILPLRYASLWLAVHYRPRRRHSEGRPMRTALAAAALAALLGTVRCPACLTRSPRGLSWRIGRAYSRWVRTAAVKDALRERNVRLLVASGAFDA